MKATGVILSSLGLLGAAAHANPDKYLASSVWDGFRRAVDCTSCQVLLGTLKLAAAVSQSTLETLLTDICKISGLEDHDVCAGVIANEAPALHYILKSLNPGSHTAKTICANIFGLCDYPAVRPFSLPFPSPKPPSHRPPPSGRRPIQVAQFSDTHVDLSYEPGSSYDCSKPICCRAYTAQDTAGNSPSPCGPWGNTKCDPPNQLQESMLAAIKAIGPSFSIYTGDVIPHDVWSVDKSEVLQGFDVAYYTMNETIGTVYGALGNHDTAPLNLFPSKKVPSSQNPQWAYDTLLEDWTLLVDSFESITDYGSYSAIHPNSKLRIISYNDILYYKFNFLVYQEPMDYDPNGQLAWLISELDAAETAGQRVWLIAHIPSGQSDYLRDYSHYFDQVVQRYDATIAAFFFGHTHRDEFQIAYSDYENRTWKTATAMGYIAPSMTPTSGPPAFRIYQVDPVTFGVLDFIQYIANISDPSYQTGPKWVLYYSAKAAYGLPDTHGINQELTPAFWHNVTETMEVNQDIFDDFWARKSRGYMVPACTKDCRQKKICALRAANSQYNCDTPIAGLHFATGPMGNSQFEPACNHAGLAPLLARIVHGMTPKEREL